MALTDIAYNRFSRAGNLNGLFQVCSRDQPSLLGVHRGDDRLENPLRVQSKTNPCSPMLRFKVTAIKNIRIGGNKVNMTFENSNSTKLEMESIKFSIPCSSLTKLTLLALKIRQIRKEFLTLTEKPEKPGP